MQEAKERRNQTIPRRRVLHLMLQSAFPFASNSMDFGRWRRAVLSTFRITPRRMRYCPRIPVWYRRAAQMVSSAAPKRNGTDTEKEMKAKAPIANTRQHTASPICMINWC